jgi:protein involved in polysaccharide export with SLBB domain
LGTVNNSAVYEIMRKDETLGELLDVAAGVPVVADPTRVMLERIQPEKSQPRTVQDFALDANGLKTTIQNGDMITIRAVLPELANAVTLRGNVSHAKRMAWRSGLRLRDLIPNREDLISRDSVRRQNEVLFAERNIAENVGNLYDEINWDYAVIERIQRADLSVELIPFNLGAVMTDAKHADNRLLQAGDIVTVFSANDIRVPLDKRRVMVRVEGEVAHPGIYPAKPHETLPELIAKAGGITPNAYVFGTGFYREEVRRSQTENQAKLIRRLEAETSTALAALSQSQGASNDANLVQARIAAAQQARAQAIDRVRSLKPEGRVALGLIPTVDNADLKLPDLRLQNGDRLVVPPKPDFVYVYGSVNTESSLIYRSGASVSDYLQQAGTGTAADRNNIIVVRADGTALTNDSGWFSRSIMNTKLMPGDAIVVPDKIDLEATWSAVVRNTKDFTQIFYQLGLGAAAIKTLKN